MTPQSDVLEDEESGRALEDSRKRRQKFNFEMVGITAGTVLHFGPVKAPGDDGEPRFIATVHSRRRILFEGEETSLTAAAVDIRGRLGLPQYWLSAANLRYVGGESLSDRRERLEQGDQDDD